MTWQRAPVAAALAALLEPLDAAVSVFAGPPETFNPDAYVVWYATNVDFDIGAFGVDVATLPILCAAGVGQWDRVEELAHAAKIAVNATPFPLDNVGVRATRQQLERIISVGGADVLAVDLVLEVRM